MNALEILVNARKLLSKKYCAGGLTDKHGNYCALGAVNQVADVAQKYYFPIRNGSPAERAVFFLENAVTGGIPDPCGFVGVDNEEDLKEIDGSNYTHETVMVNDEIGKKAVLKVFDRAINNCKRRHLSSTPMVF